MAIKTRKKRVVVNGKRFKVREGVFKIFIGVIVLYNVVLVFAIQQSESAMSMHIPPRVSDFLPIWLPQSSK